jgi:hypothetical protein
MKFVDSEWIRWLIVGSAEWKSLVARASKWLAIVPFIFLCARLLQRPRPSTKRGIALATVAVLAAVLIGTWSTDILEYVLVSHAQWKDAIIANAEAIRIPIAIIVMVLGSMFLGAVDSLRFRNWTLATATLVLALVCLGTLGTSLVGWAAMSSVVVAGTLLLFALNPDVRRWRIWSWIRYRAYRAYR